LEFFLGNIESEPRFVGFAVFYVYMVLRCLHVYQCSNVQALNTKRLPSPNLD